MTALEPADRPDVLDLMRQYDVMCRLGQTRAESAEALFASIVAELGRLYVERDEALSAVEILHGQVRAFKASAGIVQARDEDGNGWWIHDCGEVGEFTDAPSDEACSRCSLEGPWRPLLVAEGEMTDLPVPSGRQPAYDAVFAYIRRLGAQMPAERVHRNGMIWRAVTAALDADREAAYQRGLAEGRTQATEGAVADALAEVDHHVGALPYIDRAGVPYVEREWACDVVNKAAKQLLGDGWVAALRAAVERRRFAGGPWEPAEQIEPREAT